jgi:hypothetical protein
MEQGEGTALDRALREREARLAAEAQRRERADAPLPLSIVDHELETLLKDFVSRMPATTAMPFVEMVDERYPVQTSVTEGRWPRRRRVLHQAVGHRLVKNVVAEGWALVDPGRTLTVGRSATEGNPITVNPYARYCLAITTTAEPFLAVVRFGEIVVGGTWWQPDGDPTQHSNVELGRPRGADLRSVIRSRFQLQGESKGGHNWQATPMSAWQWIESYELADVVAIIAKEMARLITNADGNQ